MSDRTHNAPVPDVTDVEEHGALKPLFYILVLPFLLIALLQWSDLPASLVHLVGGP